MIASVSIAALESFFSTVFSWVINFERFGEVLKDHFFEIQTKLIPRSEYSDCNFNNIFWTSIFFEILLICSMFLKSSRSKLSFLSLETWAIDLSCSDMFKNFDE